ncbi:MFS general substrate transporter [Aspergillus affinis]|uniref:MFS general substrate transporter n=1 Tax=Aspergillus affinis TaxID=1070780 RepID=UPI0022FE5651|nr:MFS general substrate transporter [Aspergillus affinis]KAI9041811.1 MFS general substrate transporter [Aspergillus affinis]
MQSSAQPITTTERSKRNPASPYHSKPQLTWTSPNAPLHPRAWPFLKKWAATSIVSAFSFLSSVSSSMVAPMLGQVGRELGMTTVVERQLIFRFLSGIGGSAAMAIGFGALSDCWEPEQRGTAIAIYSLAPLLGPVVGPISGAWIAEKSTWRWVFWSTSAVAACVQVLGFCFLWESFAPVILKRYAKGLGLPYEGQQVQSVPRILGASLVRPTRLLTTQPVVQMIALYMAYVYGLFYLFLSTFPGVWQGVYDESIGIAGLSYISLGVGFILGAQVGGRLTDAIYVRLQTRNASVGRPEFRIPLMLGGSVLVSTGIFWYGWSVETRRHWIVPNLGVAVFGAGCIVCLQCMQAYIVDSYTRFAASAMAAAVVLRSLAGFGFPLFAPYLYERLGYGWGNSVLGFASVGLGIPAPLVFWFYGEKVRGWSRQDPTCIRILRKCSENALNDQLPPCETMKCYLLPSRTGTRPEEYRLINRE